MTALDPDIHGRLIAEIDDIARYAGVPRKYIEESMAEFCGDKEIEWVRGYKDHPRQGVFGLAYVGVGSTQRMMAMVGAFTRNFIMARLITMRDIVDLLREGDMPDPSVLVIPSFYTSLAKGALTAYQISLLWDLLEDRMIKERQTVLGIESMSKMKAGYGDHFAQLVENHYLKVYVS